MSQHVSDTPPSPSDAELLARVRAGDAAAVEALLTRHAPRIHRFGMKMCGDPEDAQDVMQETLLAAARGLPEFRGEASLSSWLFSIARSFCIKQRRRRKGQPDARAQVELGASAEAAALTDTAAAPDDALASKQLERALERAIDALDPMYREVLVLRDVEGLTAPEVSSALGLGVDAVKSRLHRARLQLRAQLAPLLDVGAPGAAPLAESAPPAASTPPVTGTSSCPDVLLLYSQNLEGEIDQALCRQLERHIDGCASCRGACQSLKRTLALCGTAKEAQVPAPLQQSVRDAIRRALRSGA